MLMTESGAPTKAFTWTPTIIKRLRGKRTQSEFGTLIGVPKNTVWRWEAGRAVPDAEHASRLSNLAENERFLEDWRLEGSLKFLGDIEEDSKRLLRLFSKCILRTARQLSASR
jgi:transcriptional regulator with XRE-family HTH domain